MVRIGLTKKIDEAAKVFNGDLAAPLRRKLDFTQITLVIRLHFTPILK